MLMDPSAGVGIGDDNWGSLIWVKLKSTACIELLSFCGVTLLLFVLNISESLFVVNTDHEKLIKLNAY